MGLRWNWRWGEEGLEMTWRVQLEVDLVCLRWLTSGLAAPLDPNFVDGS